ncbi:hypothetical protein ACQJBY_001618 [Aegilops geniculata]
MGVVSPSSPPLAAAAADSPHPTYTKMITEALTKLGGTSSRDAIAGFILGRFTNLPAAHDVGAVSSQRRFFFLGAPQLYPLSLSFSRTHENTHTHTFSKEKISFALSLPVTITGATWFPSALMATLFLSHLLQLK